MMVFVFRESIKRNTTHLFFLLEYKEELLNGKGGYLGECKGV